MIIAGLTGGIATGKSTVSEFFRAAGASIIDADKIAHKVVRKGRPAWQGIVEHFGQDILADDGEIDRQRLGDIIFRNPDEKQVLNRIVHPSVFQEMEKQMQEIREQQPDAVIIRDVPLLIESGMHKKMHPVIVVYVPEPLQLQRLMARNGFSESDALARIRSQMPIEEKKALADMVIDNSGALEQTEAQTLEIYRQLRQQADLCHSCKSRNP